jgi:hypothetical protein
MVAGFGRQVGAGMNQTAIWCGFVAKDELALVYRTVQVGHRKAADTGSRIRILGYLPELIGRKSENIR